MDDDDDYVQYFEVDLPRPAQCVDKEIILFGLRSLLLFHSLSHLWQPCPTVAVALSRRPTVPLSHKPGSFRFRWKQHHLPFRRKRTISSTS